MIYIYTKGSYLRRSCNKDTENAKYPSADSITDTRRCEIFFQGQFFALFIMACIGAFAHRYNNSFGPYSSLVQLLNLNQLPKFKLTSSNESASLLTETKARIDNDVIEGNDAIWCYVIDQLTVMAGN